LEEEEEDFSISRIFHEIWGKTVCDCVLCCVCSVGTFAAVDLCAQ